MILNSLLSLLAQMYPADLRLIHSIAQNHSPSPPPSIENPDERAPFTFSETDRSRLALRVSLRFHGDAKGPGGALRGAHISPVPALSLVERCNSITPTIRGRLSRCRPHRPISEIFRT